MEIVVGIEWIGLGAFTLATVSYLYSLIRDKNFSAQIEGLRIDGALCLMVEGLPESMGIFIFDIAPLSF